MLLRGEDGERLENPHSASWCLPICGASPLKARKVAETQTALSGQTSPMPPTTVAHGLLGVHRFPISLSRADRLILPDGTGVTPSFSLTSLEGLQQKSGAALVDRSLSKG